MLGTSDCKQNPDSYVPEYIQGTSTMADQHGLHILWLSGRCSCGYGDSGLAPNWKVPAEWGGGYMTTQCPECLGTVEYSEEWRRIDRFVPEYSDLKPPKDFGKGGQSD